MKLLINNYRNALLALLVLASCSISVAQQLPQFSQYMFNTISVNPAYAGSRETLSVVGLHRSQWVGIERSPTTQTLSIHSPLKNEQVGVGLSVINDNLGYENIAFVFGDFSYTINTGEKTKLAFGLKGGVIHYGLDSDFLTDESVTADPYFANFSNRWNPNFGVGVYFHSNRWYLGLSSPRIVKNNYNKTGKNKPEIEYVAQERNSYYFTGGAVFDIGGTTKFKPAYLVKATNGAPLSVDINANFLFNEKFWIGAGYRTNINTSSVGASTDFQVSKLLRIGYSYEHYLAKELTRYAGGTHEILLMFEVFKPETRVKSPRYF